MKEFRKQVILLAFVQAACLFIGLWVQERFTVSTAQWKANENSFQHEKADPTQFAEIKASHLLESMPVSRYFTFVWIFILQMIVTYLFLSKIYTEHSQKEVYSNEKSVIKSKELVRTRDAIIFGLAKLAESRDQDTGYHLERISLYSTLLANAMRSEPQFTRQISPKFVKLIGLSSALHDIGKVGVEDSILLKPGKLTQEERFEMQLHAKVGGNCIEEIESRLGNCNFLEMAREIAFHHHERWDGDGYPDGLMENNIPLAARIVSVADVYDALSVRRVYKDAFPHEKCVEIIEKESGSQFDPAIVKVFLKVQNEFRKIAQQFAEGDREISDNQNNQPTNSDELIKMSSEQEIMLRKVLAISEFGQEKITSSSV